MNHPGAFENYPKYEMEFSAGVSKPVDSDMFEILAVRHPQFNLVGRFSDETSLASGYVKETSSRTFSSL